MFWTARDANSITALRCSYLNSRFGNYWESHSPAFGLQCPSLVPARWPAVGFGTMALPTLLQQHGEVRERLNRAVSKTDSALLAS
jgi:hypothetical protein